MRSFGDEADKFDKCKNYDELIDSHDEDTFMKNEKNGSLLDETTLVDFDPLFEDLGTSDDGLDPSSDQTSDITPFDTNCSNGVVFNV